MKVIICDDSPLERERYSSLLNQLAGKHQVNMELAMYETGSSLLFACQEKNFAADLIFMDIHMPGITGIETAVVLREMGYVNDIVFLTVSSDKDHFRKAFSVKALHYVIKGETSHEEFEEIFLRAVQSQAEKEDRYASYTGGGETRNIPLSSIRYYEIFRKIVTVHYRDTSFAFPQISLGKLENELSPYGFYRIGQSYLVNLATIESVQRDEVTLRDGTRLPLARGKKNELRDLLAERRIGV